MSSSSDPDADARLRAALDYARLLGWPVLPIWWIRPDGTCACGGQKGCKPGKHPIGVLVPNGLKNATTDVLTLREWFATHPQANLAVRTGPESGLLVLDVDGPAGEAALATLEHRHGRLPDLYPQQWTGSGGGRWQAFMAYPDGRRVGNSVKKKLGADLDTRGLGGYAIVAPSVTRQPYRWATDRSSFDLAPPPAPAWLVDLLDPPEAPRAEWNPKSTPAGVDRYALKVLESELALAAVAPQGRRNDQLNRSAHSLFRLVPEGRLDPDIVTRGLVAAAQHAGLDQREALATIKSAAKARGVPL